MADDRGIVIAIHEAGHCATALALGYAPIAIWMKPRVIDGRSYLGLATYRSTGNARHDKATIAAAGPLAEARYYPWRGLPDRTATSAIGDRLTMDRAARQAGWRNPEMFRKLALHRAGVALDHPAIWRGAVALAGALHADYWGERMPGDVAEAILHRAGVRPGILGASDLGAKVERFARRIR